MTKWALLWAQMMLSGLAFAGQGDVLHTCYDRTVPAAVTPLETEVFVAIDQTTGLDAGLRQLVADNLKYFLVANNGFAVLTFSAYTQGHYTQVLAGGKLDAALGAEKRNDISKTALLKFDQCIARQPQLAAQMAGLALRNAYQGSSGDIAKSDVLASIKSISSLVRDSKANNKVVVIVSDMLENSSVANFYADKGRAVRKIDPAKELRTVEENLLLADFGGARVYVIGAGLLTGDERTARSYRDPKTMQALASFWTSYLNKSKAQLIEFGQPALLKPVR